MPSKTVHLTPGRLLFGLGWNIGQLGQSHARTNTSLKVLKVIDISDYCYSPNDFRNKLCETCLAVTKNSQILEIMQWSTTWRGADKPEHHSQFH